jgi:hypothetical protein
MSENNYPVKPAEQKSDRKVIEGTAKLKTKSELQKAAGSFISSDIRSVGSYALTDIVIPAIKNTVVSVIKDGIEMLFFGEARRSSNDRVPGARVDYRGMYSDRRDEPRRDEPRRVTGYEYEDIKFYNRGQAEAVLDAMGDTIAEYRFVSIGDLFDFAGLTPPAYTNVRYGWDSIRYAEIRRTRDGEYYIDLPRPRPRD